MCVRAVSFNHVIMSVVTSLKLREMRILLFPLKMIVVQEIYYAESNGHVTNDVTRSYDVIVVT